LQLEWRVRIRRHLVWVRQFSLRCRHVSLRDDVSDFFRLHQQRVLRKYDLHAKEASRGRVYRNRSVRELNLWRSMLRSTLHLLAAERSEPIQKSGIRERPLGLECAQRIAVE
jgi:hypothetical protein